MLYTIILCINFVIIAIQKLKYKIYMNRDESELEFYKFVYKTNNIG